MIPRISLSFNNGKPLGKSFLNTLYNTRNDITVEGNWIYDTLYEQRRKLGQCYKYLEKFVPGY